MQVDRKKVHRLIFFILIINLIFNTFSGMITDSMNYVSYNLLKNGLMLILVPFYLYKNKVSLADVKVKKVKIRYIIYAVIVGLLVQPLFMLGNINFQTLFFIDKSHTSSKVIDFLATNQNSSLTLTVILTIGFLTPITEELIFRGILLHSYRTLRIKIAILMSAFIFALSHTGGGIGFFAFFIGIILALFTLVSGSIIPSIIIHFIINEVFSLYMHLPKDIYTKIIDVIFSPAFQLVSFVIVSIFLVIFYFNLKKSNEFVEKEGRVFDIYTTLIIFLFLIILILNSLVFS